MNKTRMKFSKCLMAAIMFATASTFSACYESDYQAISIDADALDKQKEAATVNVDSVVEYSKQYTYSISANENADITVDGARVTTGKTFKSAADTNKVINIIAKNNTTGEVLNKKVTLDTNGKIISLDFPKVNKTTNLTVAKAKEKAAADGEVSLKNSGTISYTKSTIATLTMSEAALQKAVKDLSDDSSIALTIERPTTTEICQNLSNIEESYDVLTISCTPNKSLGTENATLKITNENFEKGMEFNCKEAVNGENVVSENGSDLTFEINKLQDVTISCNVKVQLISVDTLKTEDYFNVSLGNKSINYNTKSGYKCSYTENDFINKYLTAKFGTYTENATRSVVITNKDRLAKVPYTLKQAYYTYNVYFGSVKVIVNVFGKDVLQVHTNKARVN